MDSSSTLLTVELDDFPGYFVSNTGVLRNANGRVLKPREDKDGYLRTNLYKDVDGMRKSFTVHIHRLVAQTFIPNPDLCPVVDHIDRNIRNNHMSNLRWATVRENTLNGGLSTRNTSGYRCISFIRSRNKYQLMMTIGGKNTFMGYFDTPEDAARRWNELAPIHYKGFQPIGVNIQV
jgi:hypothetical protein